MPSGSLRKWPRPGRDALFTDPHSWRWTRMLSVSCARSFASSSLVAGPHDAIGGRWSETSPTCSGRCERVLLCTIVECLRKTPTKKGRKSEKCGGRRKKRAKFWVVRRRAVKRFGQTRQNITTLILVNLANNVGLDKERVSRAAQQVRRAATLTAELAAQSESNICEECSHRGCMTSRPHSLSEHERDRSQHATSDQQASPRNQGLQSLRRKFQSNATAVDNAMAGTRFRENIGKHPWREGTLPH